MWDAVLRAGPDYFAALSAYLDAPWQHGTLDPVVKEFVYIAVDVTATHLFPWGLRGHIRSALGMGATPGQIIGVIQVAPLSVERLNSPTSQAKNPVQNW